VNKDVYKDRSRGCLNVSPLEMKQEIDITVIRKRFPRLLSLLHVRVINFRIVLCHRPNASASCCISNYFFRFPGTCPGSAWWSSALGGRLFVTPTHQHPPPARPGSVPRSRQNMSSSSLLLLPAGL